MTDEERSRLREYIEEGERDRQVNVTRLLTPASIRVGLGAMGGLGFECASLLTSLVMRSPIDVVSLFYLVFGVAAGAVSGGLISPVASKSAVVKSGVASALFGMLGSVLLAWGAQRGRAVSLPLMVAIGLLAHLGSSVLMSRAFGIKS